MANDDVLIKKDKSCVDQQFFVKNKDSKILKGLFISFHDWHENRDLSRQLFVFGWKPNFLLYNLNTATNGAS
jgi:hypothetical protein